MPNRMSLTEKVFIYFGLSAVAMFFMLPLLWIFRTSLITKVEAYKIPPNFSAPATLDNYVNIFTANPFGHYFFNSLGVALISTVLSVLIGSMAAYWIARSKSGSGKIRVAILATQMIPPIVLVIPIALIVKRVGLDDTWFVLVVTYMTFNLPYVIWILISFFESVPKELDESCAIDGCTRLQAYFKVVLPLAAPGLMATAVYSFLVSWNEFIFALVLTGLKSRTLPVAIANLETQQGVMIAELCAATIVVIMPVVFLSLFIKKYLVEGLTFGSVK
ncbi:MAG: carbohydrate ABC transporter permease [Deltaproteobacteria bacterium]|nr:carbohydrate ABC transporter permease [Deltaproteobacteria bacterium]